jgi:hypothetical protein
MKKLLLATTLCAAFGAAQALPIVDVVNYSPYANGENTSAGIGAVSTFKGVYLNQVITGSKYTGPFTVGTNYSGYKGGSLRVDVAPADLTFTYLGYDSGHKESFTYDLEGDQTFTFYSRKISSTVGATLKGTEVSVSVGSKGSIEMEFKDITAKSSAFSGYARTNDFNSKFGFLDVRDRDFGMGIGEYDYMIVFNDFYNDTDYNDMAIGVKGVSAIPEPETYALLMAGLGVVGFMARRRRKA